MLESVRASDGDSRGQASEDPRVSGRQACLSFRTAFPLFWMYFLRSVRVAYPAMHYALNFEYLLARLSEQRGQDDIDIVRRAYEVAQVAHSGQLRDEGSPYIVHPVRVAVSLADELKIYSS